MPLPSSYYKMTISLFAWESGWEPHWQGASYSRSKNNSDRWRFSKMTVHCAASQRKWCIWTYMEWSQVKGTFLCGWNLDQESVVDLIQFSEELHHLIPLPIYCQRIQRKIHFLEQKNATWRWCEPSCLFLMGIYTIWNLMHPMDPIMHMDWFLFQWLFSSDLHRQMDGRWCI